MKQLDVVYLEWLDSASLSGWDSIDSARMNDDPPIRSVGIVVRETKDFLTITTSWADHCTGETGVTDVLAIPKCAILKRRAVKL